MIGIGRIDPARVIAALGKVERQVRFGTARGLTLLAKEAAGTVNREMPRRFDRPNPFTMKAAAFLPATRETLRSTVFVKDIQASYLLIEETGGTRVPRPGKPVVVPVRQRVNRYGNIPRGSIKRLKDRPDVFVSDGRRDRVRHLPPGIYQRFNVPKRKASTGRRKGMAARARPPKLLVAFEKKASYRPRFQFRATVIGVARQRVRPVVGGSIREALATARW